MSSLQNPAIRLNLNPNLFLLFLYLSLMILNLLTKPITFSLTTLWEERSLLDFFISFVRDFSDFFLFIGSFVFLWILSIPVYPESTKSFMFSIKWTLLSLKSLMSCFFPLQKSVHIIFLDFLSTTTCVFKVCLFFFPE